jgi:hypothetical protein
MKSFVGAILFSLTSSFLLSACQLIFGSLAVPGIYVCDSLTNSSGKILPSKILAFKKDGTVEILTSLSKLNDKNPGSYYEIKWNKVILQGALSGKFLIKGNELISDDAIKLRCKLRK